jgi:ubiquinone/menaquinone biosynthesis C-methylase UbiE
MRSSRRPRPSTSRRGIYSRLFAKHYDRIVAGYESFIEPQKRALFATVGGTVVEIGSGTGANLKYLPTGCRWIGIEPNPFMHRQALEKARQVGVDAEVRTSSAEDMDLDDASADFVVATLVLCSVPRVDVVLGEVRRVLKPEGRFLFLEHVAAPEGTARRWLQRLVFPLWYVCGDGCRVNRDTGRSIRQAGFSQVDIEKFELPIPPSLPWVSTHVIGSAHA